ncbi:RNA/RNP complex-1-interacting phosphatase homolog isoform X2 [Watersipora subatra]
MGRGIPDRWEEYTKMGKPMKADELKSRFLSFKVPLKPQLTQSLEESKTFSPTDLIKKCKESNINLGLIIDLTFTKRYYSPNEFTNAGIEYVKIPVEGQMVPKRARLDKFTEVVEKFMVDNKEKDGVIGVHCTHGVNRTGYLICKYLVEREQMDPEKAIKLFNTCRGHEMEREIYLQNLRTGEIPEAEKESYEKGEYDAPQWKTNKPDYQQTGEPSHRYEWRDEWRQRGYDRDRYGYYSSGPYYEKYEQYRYDSYDRDSHHRNSYHHDSSYRRDSYRHDPYHRDFQYRDTDSFYRQKGSQWSADRDYYRDDYSQAPSNDASSNRARTSGSLDSKNRKRRSDDHTPSQDEPTKRNKSSCTSTGMDEGVSHAKKLKTDDGQ